MRWNKLNARRLGQYYGVVVDSPTDPLSNLRFADDVLLFSSSPSDAAKMISDLKNEAAKFGLKLHMGKTVVLTNRAVGRPATISCAGQDIKVASPDDTEKYLGRKLSISAYHHTEFGNRLASAWAAFFKSKEVFCNKKVPLADRIKLFECTVTPCMLYACGSWTLTKDMERKLSTTKRRMLRWIVGVPRLPQEQWTEYIQRATHRIEDLSRQHGATDWVLLQRTRKFNAAGKAALSTDGRWSHRLLKWRPWFRVPAYRNVGRPHKRWDDDLVAVAGESWPEATGDSAAWSALREAYIYVRAAA